MKSQYKVEEDGTIRVGRVFSLVAVVAFNIMIDVWQWMGANEPLQYLKESLPVYIFFYGALIHLLRIALFTYKIGINGIERRGIFGKKLFAWEKFVDIYVVKWHCGIGKEQHDVECVVFATRKRRPRIRPSTAGYIFTYNRYIAIALESKEFPIDIFDKLGRFMSKDAFGQIVEKCCLKVMGYPTSLDYEATKHLFLENS